MTPPPPPPALSVPSNGLSFFFLINCVYVFTIFILTQWCYSVVLCMSLLDSACRIGHRKYLLKMNSWDLKYTRHFSDFSLVTSGVERDPRIHRSPWTHRIPRSFECRCSPGSLDSRIVRSLDVPQAEDPRNFEFSDFGNAGSLGPWIRTIGGSRILGLWQE